VPTTPRARDEAKKPATSRPEEKREERSARTHSPLAGAKPTTAELEVLLELSKSSVNSPAIRILQTELEKRSR
jgi:hypothetical protein